MSNFCPDTRGRRSLVQSCCGEGGTLQTNITGMCGEYSQCLGHTEFAPLTSCVFSQSTLLRLQVALQGMGPKLCALPRSKLLRFRFSGTPQRRRLRWACVLCCSSFRAAQATRCLVSALSSGAVHLHLPGPSHLFRRPSPVCHVSLLGS